MLDIVCDTTTVPQLMDTYLLASHNNYSSEPIAHFSNSQCDSVLKGARFAQIIVVCGRGALLGSMGASTQEQLTLEATWHLPSSWHMQVRVSRCLLASEALVDHMPET